MNRGSRILFIEGDREHRGQGGLVLEVVLIALVALILTAVGLLRSVDTSTGVAGNIVFKRDAENRAHLAIDDALSWLTTPANRSAYIVDGVDCTACNYSSRMLQTDSKGIPVVLSGDVAAFDRAYTRQATSRMSTESVDGIRVRYLIERMCTRSGAPTSRYCTMTSGSGGEIGGGTQPMAGPVGRTGGVLSPMLRLSIRVDGPRNTVAYLQVMINP